VVDAFAIHDLELGLFERQRHLVFDEFYAGFAAPSSPSFAAPDGQAYGREGFKGITAGGDLRLKCALSNLTQ